MSEETKSDTPRTDKWLRVCIQEHSMVICARALERELATEKAKTAAALSIAEDARKELADAHGVARALETRLAELSISLPEDCRLAPMSVDARLTVANMKSRAGEYAFVVPFNISMKIERDFNYVRKQLAEANRRLEFIEAGNAQLQGQIQDANRRLEVAVKNLFGIRDSFWTDGESLSDRICDLKNMAGAALCEMGVFQ